MRLLEITDSPDPKKRYMAIFEMDNARLKRVKFGDPHMESYVMHGDKRRRDSYRKRHLRDLNTGDPTRAGYLSMFILWGASKNIEKNIEKYKEMFDL